MKDVAIGLVVFFALMFVLAFAVVELSGDGGEPGANRDDPCLVQKCD